MLGIIPIIYWFCRFCSFLEGGIISRICSQTMASWEYCFSWYSHKCHQLDHKPWHHGSTVFHDTPCSQTMASWEYCFSWYSLCVKKSNWLKMNVETESPPVQHPGQKPYMMGSVTPGEPCLSTLPPLLNSEYCKTPWFLNREHHGKQYSHDAMVCEQGVSWKTVLPWWLPRWLPRREGRHGQGEGHHGHGEGHHGNGDTQERSEVLVLVRSEIAAIKVIAATEDGQNGGMEARRVRGRTGEWNMYCMFPGEAGHLC